MENEIKHLLYSSQAYQWKSLPIADEKLHSFTSADSGIGQRTTLYPLAVFVC